MKEYILSNPGKLCSDQSLDYINDKDDCNKAHTALEDDYDEVKTYPISSKWTWPERPKGCFLHLKNGTVGWNLHPTGSRNNEDRQICGKSKYFSTYHTLWIIIKRHLSHLNWVIFLFLLEKRYLYKRVSSMNCAFHGMKPVSSKEECELAATSLGFSNATVYSSDPSSRPHGCIYASIDWLGWQSMPSSVPCGAKSSNSISAYRYYYDCFCKKEGKGWYLFYLDYRIKDAANLIFMSWYAVFFIHF